MSEHASILVVDDEPKWLEPLTRVLMAAGYVVRPAGSGEAALAAVSAALPDLILLDVRMPGMDGFEVIRRLKAQEMSREIPVLLLSAFAEVDERIEGLKLGAVDSVTKPFHAGELLARVRMQVEMSRLRAQHALHAEEMKATNQRLQDEIARRQQVEEALQSRYAALTLPIDNPEAIKFSDLFEIESIQQLQEQFSDATGVASIITSPDGTPITKPSNFCRLCSIIRKTEIGRCNCYESDAVLGAPRASGPTIQPCLSGGLWDAGASITVGGKHVANWLIGQIRNDAQNEEEMLEYAEKIGADRDAFREALAEVPVMSEERFSKTADLLFSFANELSARAYQNIQQARFISERQTAEEELRRSEARLSFALRTLGAGAWELDLVNHTAHRTLLHDRIFGYPALLPDWTYEIFLEHVLPEDRPEVDRCFREATGTLTDWSFECRIRRVDGEIRWILATGAHELDEDGKPLKLTGVVQDITQRRLLEDSIRENEDSLTITLNSIGDGVIATDDDGLITRMNPAAERMTGWDFAEAVGRPMKEIFRIFDARHRKPVEDPVEIVRKSGAVVGLANDTILVSKNGTEHQIADSAAPILDSSGMLKGVVLVFSDVTERYEAGKALERREHDYRLLFEGMLEGFALHEIICDESGRPVDYRFLSINPAFEKITGHRASETVGRTVREIMPETEAVWIERFGQVALTGEVVHFENHSAALGRDFQVTAYRPQAGQFAVVFEDITERKAAETRVARLSQLYSALSQCNQAIVHSTSVEELLPKICRDVVEFGGMKMAWIGLIDEVTGVVCPVASNGEGREFLEGIRVSIDPQAPFGSGLAGTAVRESRPVWCQDFLNDPATFPSHEQGERSDWKSGAALPLRRGRKTIGCLTMLSDKVNVFDAEARALLEEMADDLSFAFESFANEAERKRMEAALSESEETMRLIVKHDPTALAIFDSGMRYIAVSDRFIQDYNVTADIIGKHHYDVFPEIPQVWRDVHQRCLAGAVEKKDDDRFVRPDGSITYTRWECRPWYRAGGEIGGIIMYTEVVTARKLAEEALRESEERFRLMLQHISTVSVQGYHKDGTTHYWNDASEVLYGYTAAEAVGKNLLDLIIPPEMRESVREGVAAMCRTLQPIPASELTLMRKDGSPVTVYSSHAVVCRHGHEPEFFCIDIDLTDRKRAEEALVELNRYLADATTRAEELAVKAESAARAKSEFLALMSHELRTPLNGVLGFAELLSGTRLDEEQQEFTKTILDSGNHLLDVVNDILDFSSIEKGRMQIDAARISIATLLEAASRPIRKIASDKGIEVHCVKAGDVPDEITGDARRIRQILLNLLGNAVKFTEEGSVVLGITMSSDDGRPVLEFSVEDTGPGIPRETIGRLFKPFTQADSTVSRRFEGTGLGLAISLRLAEAMGGTLDVESTPGQGSRFTFRLPLDAGALVPVETAPAMHEEIRSDKSDATEVPQARNFQTVLVVEDDASNRILAGKMLAHLGFRAEFACNGQEALDIFEPSRFSAILMDMQMPLLDGLEATRKIRRIESGSRIPIIALTANVMPGDRERCLEAGMDDFLTKPFKMRDLSDKLASFLHS